MCELTHSTLPYFYPGNYLAKRCVKCKAFFPQLEEQSYCLSALLMLSLIGIHLLIALPSSQIFKWKLSLKCLKNCKSENEGHSGIRAAVVCLWGFFKVCNFQVYHKNFQC